MGEKTAAKWIREYGSLAELVDHVDQVGGKVGDALRAALPQVLVNRRLTHLVDDVPVTLDLDEAVLAPWDRAAVDRLFDTLQFRALRERLDKVRPAADDEPASPAEAARAGRRDRRPGGGRRGGVAGRRRGVPGGRRWPARGHAAAARSTRPPWSTTAASSATSTARDPAVAQALLDWLADPAAPKDLHDAKGAALALVDRGAVAGRSPAGHRARRRTWMPPATAATGWPTSPSASSGVSVEVGAGGDQLLFDTGREAAEGLAREAGVVRLLAADARPAARRAGRARTC